MKDRELDRQWEIYLAGTRNGDIPNFRSLGLAIGDLHSLGFAEVPSGPEETDKAVFITSGLVTLWHQYRQSTAKEGNDMDDEKKLLDLGLLFLEVAEFGPSSEFKEILEKGFPINFQHPRHKYNALHMAVTENTQDNHEIVKLLLNSDQKIDLLTEDEFDRVPWDNAVLYNFDENLTTEIFKQSQLQADEEGIDLRQEFRRKFRAQWMRSHWFRHISRSMTFDFDDDGPAIK